ncbi:hypothetical protein BDF21DRAFT_446758 [Thamnidium elegans]|nr:hypothetical protein BDF21DRAFT_446758 [Thamnidium elegans]
MLSSATINSVEQTWSAFKNKRTAVDLYAEDAVIMYVPTSVGVRGSAQIRKFFLSNQFSEKVNPVQEEVYNTVTGSNKLIEEVTWSIHFHSGECKWLVPHIEERFLMNSTIKFPVTTSVSFNKEHKIESIRYLWDQACVLKQLQVISSNVKWPIVGKEQVDTLCSPKTVQLIGLNDQPVNTDHQKTQQEQDKNQFPAGRIFGPVDPKDQVRQPTRRADPNAPALRNIFTFQPPSQRPLVAANPNKLGSSFSFTHDEGKHRNIIG